MRRTMVIGLVVLAVLAAVGIGVGAYNAGVSEGLQQSGQGARASVMYRQVLAAPPRYARERQSAAKLLAAIGSSR